MKRFLLRCILFTLLLGAVLCAALFWVKNPVAGESVLGALPDKHELLEKAPSPKIIFVGGSNLSFGLDSERISEAFHMPVVNTGIHGGIGLKYMMSDVLPYVRKNDIVVLAPEYAYFHDLIYYGEIELVSVLFDVFPEGRQFISLHQWERLAPSVLRYAATKIMDIPLGVVRSLMGQPKTTDIYRRQSFNRFGDAVAHWNKPNEIVVCAEKCSGKETVNPDVLADIHEFKSNVQKTGALLIMLPPVYQECSFNHREFIINRIEYELRKNGPAYMASPLRYRLPDGYFLNTPYHLNKKGVDLRTTMMIEDLKRLLGS